YRSLSSTVDVLYGHWRLVCRSLIAVMITLLLPKIFEKQMAKASLNTTKENGRFLSRVSEAFAAFDTLFSYSLLENITKDTQAASLNLADGKNEQAVVVS